VTEGQEAMGEATVKIRDNGTQVIGRAATTDVVEASVMAYVNAMNKIVEERVTRGQRIAQVNVPYAHRLALTKPPLAREGEGAFAT
jgi:hypothetical protein